MCSHHKTTITKYYLLFLICFFSVNCYFFLTFSGRIYSTSKLRSKLNTRNLKELNYTLKTFIFLNTIIKLYLLFSQTIESIGYPATGQCTTMFSPATTAALSIGLLVHYLVIIGYTWENGWWENELGISELRTFYFLLLVIYLMVSWVFTDNFIW